jgi:DNA repair protein RadD
MKLRPYQTEAVEAVYKHLQERDDNPCVVIPTAGGKTIIFSTIIKDAIQKWNGRVLILAHVKELLQQAVDKLNAIAPELMIGVYSAGLKSRDTLAPVIIAGIQSVYKRACELGAFDLVLLDECHHLNPSGEGIYQTFLSDMKVINPNVRLIGLTATPYRMKSGMICSPDNLLNHVCYEIGIKELINQGYLCPLISKAGRREVDTSKLHIRNGEFIPSEAEELMDDENLILAACCEIVSYTKNRKSCLIFAAGIKHAEHIADTLRKEHNVEVECVFGETSSLFREQHIEDFKNGKLKYLVNVGVLTTGFDAPNIDCVVLLRPTNSPGLFYQCCGRGFRLHPGKEDCLVLDYGGNIMRHGPVDAIQVNEPGKGNGEAPAKKCPDCNAVIHAAYQKCPQCGYEFPPPKKNKHDANAATVGIISGQTNYIDYEVKSVEYSIHYKRGAEPGTPRTMRVEYCVGPDAIRGDNIASNSSRFTPFGSRYISEWVCPEHTGYARAKFEVWWAKRSEAPAPSNVEETVILARDGSLAEPHKIIVKTIAGEKFDRVVDYELGPIPKFIPEPGYDDEGFNHDYEYEDDYEEDQIPF